MLARRPELSDTDRAAVEADFVEVTRHAEELVAEITGLSPVAGRAQPHTVDRSQWVDANLASFAQILTPLLERSGTSRWARLSQVAPIGRQAAGVEIGALLAWMSTRVLGQYDILPGTPAGQDAIYYVAPNIVAIERRHGFAPRDFRLWIAVHEVTHRAQFTGVAWMEGYFRDLVARGTAISFDPSGVVEALGRAVASMRSGENPLGDSGLIGVLASSEQLATVREAQALMSLLEGHADVVMSSVAEDVIPGATRFARVLSDRRQSARGGAKLLQQLLGVEAKLRQYHDGERFVDAIVADRGMARFSEIWSGPEMLPTLEEIRDPLQWMARVDGGVAAPA